MTTEKFKLPRSSYDEIIKIIIAYGKSDKPASLSDIFQSTGINTTHISDNNSFLLAVGLIEGGKAKSPTPKCRALSSALDHTYVDKIANGWAVVIQENEFLNKILLAISIRKGMDESQLQTHIAYSAGEPKSDAVMTGARTVIDILRHSGLVEEQDGHIVVSRVISPETDDTGTRKDLPLEPNKVSTTKRSLSSSYTFHIEIRINATPSELDGLGEKLKALRRSLEDDKSEEDD
jgi:hypothetical protein